MIKKTILAVSALTMLSGALYANNAPTTVSKQDVVIAQIYTTNDVKSPVAEVVKLSNRDNYNIFFCQPDNWCKVVNRTNGNVGWVNLDDLQKTVKKEQSERNYDSEIIKQVVEYNRMQDQKIMQLEGVILRMQKDFAMALQSQQHQISQLQKTIYS